VFRSGIPEIHAQEIPTVIEDDLKEIDMNGCFRPTLATACALAALAMFAGSAAGAAVYTPTRTTDSADGACDADCSLREAVMAANARPGEDVILLRAGTYRLTIAGNENGGAAGDLNLQDDLVLIGDGASRTVIDGGAVDRIFQVPGGITAEIRNVTLRNGRSLGAGGAIRNEGTLTIARSVITGNASVTGAAGAGFGGAILTDGMTSALTVTDSAVTGNTAQGGGGGFAISGQATLNNVTISGNRSLADFGGGLYVFSDSRAFLHNATVVGNSAALQGGGILAENTAFIGFAPRVTNSIIAGNTAPARPDCSGSLDSAYDLIGTGTGCNGPSTAKGDLVGTAAAPIDPRIGALAENGGPTPTHSLLAGSPALNTGSPAGGAASDACEDTDQRGAARPAGNRCDIGAFEVTTACVPGGDTLCLAGGRFKVTAIWQRRNAGGTARATGLSEESGFFYFAEPSNVELTVKILNRCSQSNRFIVFASGLTSVRVNLTVTDTRTGQVKTYTNPLGQAFRLIQDSTTFACQ
jgi:CSLREA domain-containing protein